MSSDPDNQVYDFDLPDDYDRFLSRLHDDDGCPHPGFMASDGDDDPLPTAA